MAKSGNYRGITIQLGADTTNISNALSSVEKQSRNLQDELKEINKGLKLDPSNTELIKQKFEILGKSVQTTSERLKTLESVQKQVEQQFNSGNLGEAQYRSFQRAIANTQSQLKQFTQQQDEVKDLMNGFKTGSQSVKELGESISEVSASTIAKGQLMADALEQVITKLVSIADSTREYRTELSLLETNAEQAGNSFDTVKSALKDLNAITGENDSNIEALSDLMATGFTDSQLLETVNALSGAVIQFPDTLKIESLADSLQETLASGKSTGQFDELLNRMGINLNNWNTGLQEAITSGEQYQYILDTLASTGLANVNEAYRETNATLINAANAQFDLNDAMAEIGDKIDPVVTELKQGLVETILNNMPEIESSIENAGDALITLMQTAIKFKDVIISSAAALATYKTALSLGNLISGLVSALKSFTTAQSAATAAQATFNATSAANPYVLLASVITSAVVSIGTFIALQDKATDKLKEYNTALQEAKESGEETLASGEAEISLLQQKADKYEELRTKANRTVEEETQLKQIALELQEVLPDNISIIDAKTGAYNNLANAIDTVIAKEKASLKAESLKPAALEAQKQLNELEKQLEDLQAERRTFQNNVNNGNYANELQGMTQEQIEATLDNEYTRIEEEQAKIRAAIKDRQAIVDEYMDAYADTSSSNGDTVLSNHFSNYTSNDNTSRIEDAAKKEISALKYKYQMEQITAKEYYNQLDVLNKKYYANNEDYLDEYREYNVEVYNGLKQIAEDAYKFEKSKLDNALARNLISTEEYYKQYKALTEKYNTEQEEYLNDYYQYQIEAQKEAQQALLESKKEALQAEKDKLSEINEERQEAIDLEQALQDLENARNNKTVTTYYNDRGFVNEVDKQAVSDAENKVAKLAIDSEIDKIDDLITALDNESENAIENADAYLSSISNSSLTDTINSLLSNLNNSLSTLDLSNISIPSASSITTANNTSNSYGIDSLTVQYQAGNIYIQGISDELTAKIKQEIQNSYADFTNETVNTVQEELLKLLNGTILQTNNR